MFEFMKVVNIIYKYNLKNLFVVWKEVFLMLFKNNRKIVENYFEGKFGVIDKGGNVDLIIIDYDLLILMDKINYILYILFGMMGKLVDIIIVNGKIVFKNGEFVDIDEKKILIKLREVSRKMWCKV